MYDYFWFEILVFDVDSEFDYDYKGGIKFFLESVKYGIVKYFFDFDLVKCVLLDEKLDYLVRNVFEWLYYGVRSLKKL